MDERKTKIENSEVEIDNTILSLNRVKVNVSIEQTELIIVSDVHDI